MVVGFLPRESTTPVVYDNSVAKQHLERDNICLHLRYQTNLGYLWFEL